MMLQGFINTTDTKQQVSCKFDHVSTTGQVVKFEVLIFFYFLSSFLKVSS